MSILVCAKTFASSSSSMETVVHSSVALLTPKLTNNGSSANQNSRLLLSSPPPPPPLKLCVSQSQSQSQRRSVMVRAKKKKDKQDSHSFVPKPDEATGPFPEAVLLKPKKVEKDGEFLPEFADADEEKIYEVLKLQLENDLQVESLRHYEVVYLIHEKYEEEVEKVNEKVKDFLREKRGKIWRLNDWGMRRLAYKIQKAKNAHYILMNFEMEAKWINDFKTMLDKDERVIRHLVMKRDEAITEDCPPPPEFHTLRAAIDDDEEEDLDYEDEDYDEDGDGEDEIGTFGDEEEDGIIFVNSDEEDEDRTRSLTSRTRINKLRAEKVGASLSRTNGSGNKQLLKFPLLTTTCITNVL